MVPANIAKMAPYTGNGSTTTYAYAFPIVESSDLIVTRYDTSTIPVPGVLVLNTDYTVTGVGTAGGNVVLTTALPLNYKLLIQRVVPVVQDTDIRNQGPYFPEIIESSFDYLTLICQQILEQVNRTFVTPELDLQTAPLQLPNIATRANQFFAFDGSGNPVAAASVSMTFVVSSYMQTLLAAASAPAAKALLQATLMEDTTDQSKQVQQVLSGISPGTTRNWTYPDFSDTYLGLTGTQTPTNKTIDVGPSATNVLKSTGATLGQVPAADGANGTSWISPTYHNHLINGLFEIWQRFTSVSSIANGTTFFGPDRWYCKNSLGTNGTLQIDQVTGVSVGSKFGFQLKITTAPTAAQANGCEMYQTLENTESVLLYNKTACFQAQLKAFGNVSQIGIQFYSNTTEAKVTTPIGTEVLVAVNTSTFSLGSIIAQALGTAQTMSGVIGVRIRIAAVSTGNTYDLNNGFVVEQAAINVGSKLAPFARQGRSYAEELATCQRFYEKSFDQGVAPGTVSAGGCVSIQRTSGVSTDQFGVRYEVAKRAAGTVTVYSTGTGASGNIRNQSAGTDTAATSVGGMSGFTISFTAAATTPYNFQFATDAEI